MSRISAPRGSFGYAQDRLFDSAPSPVPRDKSVRRFAQDDDFVGGLKKNTANRLTLVGRSPGVWSFILESADTNVFEAHEVWPCISARLQSCRTGLKQCWALAPAVFSWPISATGREKLLSNLVFRAGLATARAKQTA